MIARFTALRDVPKTAGYKIGNIDGPAKVQEKFPDNKLLLLNVIVTFPDVPNNSVPESST